MNRLVMLSLLSLGLTACSVQTAGTVGQQEGTLSSDKQGLERRIQRFSKPDKYGVVCYQDYATTNNLSCVQVTEGTNNL